MIAVILNSLQYPKLTKFGMKEIILQGVIFILLVGYIFLIRFFKKNKSNQRTPVRLIDSMRLKCEGLKLQIEQQNKEIASLLTENEQLKEALRGDAGYVIERNNKEIRSLKEEIWQLQKVNEKSQSLHSSQEFDRFVDKRLW